MLNSLGIIIFTDDKFDIDKKFVFLLRCINSIERQKQDNIKIVFLSKKKVDKQYIEKMPPHIQVKISKNRAKGINECIEELECSHVLFVRYDTIFSLNSLNQMLSLDPDGGMLFNYCAKPSSGTLALEPFLDNVSMATQFEKLPFVYNDIFSKDIIVKNNIKFTNFKYSDQYFFVLKYYKASDKIKFVNDVLLCYDRSFKIKFKFTDEFFLENYEEIFEVAKHFRDKKDTDMIGFMMRDFGIPLLQWRYSEETKKNVRLNVMISKRLMKILMDI